MWPSKQSRWGKCAHTCWRQNIITILSFHSPRVPFKQHLLLSYAPRPNSDIILWKHRLSSRFVRRLLSITTLSIKGLSAEWLRCIDQCVTSYRGDRRGVGWWLKTCQLLSDLYNLKTCFTLSESSLSCLHSALDVLSLLLCEQISRFDVRVLDIGFFLPQLFPLWILETVHSCRCLLF